jgi:serine/threonine protein kinase
MSGDREGSAPGAPRPEGPPGKRDGNGETACPRCGRRHPSIANFCLRCGVPLRGAAAAPGEPGGLALSLPEAPPSPAAASSASLALNSLAALDRADATRPSPAAAGRVFAGRFRIGKVLGRGGLGVVYRAWDERGQEPVALKVLLPELMQDPGLLERFRDQVEILTRLSHPRIVPLLDAGSAEDVAWLAMPVMGGGSLRAWIRARRARRRTREDLLRALGWAWQVLDGLAYAHRFVVHRDLKPENILLDGEGFARIADFDLAKYRKASPITLTGQAVGTAYYMAPEQIRDPSAVTPAADQFSLGVTVYEMLSGELPVGAFRPLSRLVRGTPPGLDEFLARLLAYEPPDRFPDAARAAWALAEVLQRIVRPAEAPSGAARPRRPSAFLDWLVGRLVRGEGAGGEGGRER